MNTATLNPTLPLRTTRVESIDLLRGLVMIIMALDHVRDYFHADAFLFNPVDLDKTNAPLFFTRWITHFCATVFVFLAGTSAFLVGSRKGKKELTAFLLKRGLWILVLEFTVINFSWFFNIHFSMIAITVISALGASMIALAAFIHLPFKAILVFGLLFVFGHNALDGIHVEGDGAGALLWGFTHGGGAFNFPGFLLFIGYPFLPWTGVMLLGYCFGSLYLPSQNGEERRRLLRYFGIAAIALFIILRFINIYGDPSHWSVQKDGLFTLLSFLNVTKYPPSLLYLLVTLGPAMLLLSVSEGWRGKFAQYVIALGRVPMFYYILHIYLIHILAVFAALATGYSLADMTFTMWVTDSPNLKGYGFNLGITYLVWIAVLLALYPLCLRYDAYKQNNKTKWWLSYL